MTVSSVVMDKIGERKREMQSDVLLRMVLTMTVLWILKIISIIVLIKLHSYIQATDRSILSDWLSVCSSVWRYLYTNIYLFRIFNNTPHSNGYIFNAGKNTLPPTQLSSIWQIFEYAQIISIQSAFAAVTH